MRKSLTLIVLAAIGSTVSVASYAQQNNQGIKTPDPGSARVLSEDQINAYWLYAQERINKNDFRTAIATLYFLVNAQGLSDEMRETADRALSQSLKNLELIKSGRPPGDRGVAATAVASSAPAIQTVVLEEVSSTTVVDSVESQTIALSAQSPKRPNNEDKQDNRAIKPTEDTNSTPEKKVVNRELAVVVSGPSVGTLDSLSEDPGTQFKSSTNAKSEPEISVESASPATESHENITQSLTDVLVQTPEQESEAEVQDVSPDYDLAIEFSLSREDTNTTFTDTIDSQGSETAADVSITLSHSFSPVLSGSLDVSLPISQAESAASVDEVFLQYLFSRDVYAGDVIVGTQSISESRGWMYDSTLDLISTSVNSERWNLTVGVGAETQDNFWTDLFERESDAVYRWIGEYTRQLDDQHRLSLILTGLNDSSAASDDIETEAVWIGARAQGGFSLANESQLDYWLDVGSVSGKERTFESSEDDAGVTSQVLLSETDLGGWGYDFGATWSTSDVPGKPEFTLAIAGTSKDADLSDSAEKGYRQSGLHGNSVDIGRVTDLAIYGLALDPELSNLRISTAGVTFPLLASSYFSVFYHKYNQVSAATELRDASLDVALTGLSGDVGHAIDVIVGYEDAELWSVSLSAGFFEAGNGAEQPDASAYFGLVDFSYDF